MMDVCCGGRKDDEESAMLRCLVAERKRRSWNSEHKPHEFHSLLSSSWTAYCCEIGGCLFNSSWCCILMLGWVEWGRGSTIFSSKLGTKNRGWKDEGPLNSSAVLCALSLSLLS
ncbi:unnamed protein product [Musa textilis]